jgi:hypothetical protein
MPLYDVIELVSATVVRSAVPLATAYRIRDEHQRQMLRAGRSLERKRYGVRPAAAKPVTILLLISFGLRTLFRYRHTGTV